MPVYKEIFTPKISYTYPDKKFSKQKIFSWLLEKTNFETENFLYLKN